MKWILNLLSNPIFPKITIHTSVLKLNNAENIILLILTKKAI